MTVFIDKVGFELEGHYHSEEEISYSSDSFDIIGDEIEYKVGEEFFYDAKEDGSLEKSDTRDWYALEFVTKPMKPDRVPVFWDKFSKIEFCPHTSAGLHFHLSFVDNNGESVKPHDIWSTDFYNKFLHHIKDSYPDIWDERSGNDYCKAYFGQDACLSTDRYKAINNICAWNTHKTLEIRILPSMPTERAKKVTMDLIGWISDYLSKRGAKKMFTFSERNFFYRIEKTSIQRKYEEETTMFRFIAGRRESINSLEHAFIENITPEARIAGHHDVRLNTGRQEWLSGHIF